MAVARADQSTSVLSQPSAVSMRERVRSPVAFGRDSDAPSTFRLDRSAEPGGPRPAARADEAKPKAERSQSQAAGREAAGNRSQTETSGTDAQADRTESEPKPVNASKAGKPDAPGASGSPVGKIAGPEPAPEEPSDALVDDTDEGLVSDESQPPASTVVAQSPSQEPPLGTTEIVPPPTSIRPPTEMLAPPSPTQPQAERASQAEAQAPKEAHRADALQRAVAVGGPDTAVMDPGVVASNEAMAAPRGEAARAAVIDGSGSFATLLEKSADAPAGVLASNQGPTPTSASAAETSRTTSAAPQTTQPTPLGSVPMTIGLRAMEGTNRFEIRLDPVDLGRIDVRLDIDKENGTMSADLVVDRPATLALLQRDAGTLLQALAQAGFDTGGGINLSLRDGNASGGQNPGNGTARNQTAPDGTPHQDALEPNERAPTALLRLAGIDIRI